MLRLLTESLILLAICATATWATFQLHPYAPSLYLQMEPLREDEVTLEMVEEQWGGNVQWVDARISEQFAEEHIPGAININEQNFSEQVLAHLLEDYTIVDSILEGQSRLVIYCAKEACQASRKIADKLKQNLPAIAEQIFVLKDGWPAYEKAHP